MTTHSIKTVWRKNNIFDTELDGHNLTIDLSKEAGGDDAGPRPKKLVLAAATGCTGLDVVEILKKMRIDVKNFSIDLEAELTTEYPITYTSMKVIYEFEGDNLPQQKIERACKLSFDNYCGVMALLKKAIPVTYEVRIK